MSLLRSALALIVAFVVTAILLVAPTMAADALREAIGWEPAEASLAFGIVVSVAAGAAGGVVLAAIAPGAPFAHAAVFAAVVVVFDMFQSADEAPAWNDLLSLAAFVFGLFLGVVLWRRRRRVSA
ncbi:MAG TPA: hypothetical protein VG889_08025 [Rhizomicrobium sp.]|nr:hypothetical protein [Rhizomicrobium sp.]